MYVKKNEINETLKRVADCLLKLDTAPGADRIASGESETVNLQRKGFYARDFGFQEWDWPQGVGLYGLLRLQEARENHEFLPFITGWAEQNIRRGLPSENINTTAPYLALLELDDPGKGLGLEALCLCRAEFLMHDLPRTEENGFEHVTTAAEDRNEIWRHPNELWIDTLFMAVLFLAKMGVQYDDLSWQKEARDQFMLHIQHLSDEQTGLFYHGWTYEKKNHFGGVFWCRGNAWFTYAAVTFLEVMGNRLSSNDQKVIVNTLQNQVRGLLEYQDQCGLWHTVLNMPDSYIETSGSAGIIAGILKGIHLGFLCDDFLPAAEKGINELIRYISKDGTVGNVSAGTAIGMDAEHYKSILIQPMAYGQSMAILALAEALMI